MRDQKTAFQTNACVVQEALDAGKVCILSRVLTESMPVVEGYLLQLL